MPRIKFTGLETGIKKKNSTLNCISGIDENGQVFSQRYFASDAGINAVVSTLKPGDEINCVMVQKGNYENLAAVTLIKRAAEGAPAQAPVTGTTQQGVDYNKREKVATAGGFRPPGDISRTEALRLAVELISDLPTPGMDLVGVTESVLGTAKIFNDYITGKMETQAAKPAPKRAAAKPATEPAEYELGPTTTRSPHDGDDIPY